MTGLARFEGTVYALLRIIVGLLFFCHGLQKLGGVFGGTPPEAPAFVVWVAGSIELVGGFLVAIGLFTRWAAFVSSGLMAFAYFMAHQPRGALPITNQGELAVVYCWLFLYIAARGAGRWSVDGERG